MRGVRSFGLVPTCSGWGVSHIERFRPLRMTVLGERIGSQGWCAAFLEDGIPVSQPSPLGESAPQGRIGQTCYERQLG